MSNRKFSLTDWNRRHFASTEVYAGQVQLLFQAALREATRIAVTLNIDPNKAFTFKSYPASSAQINSLMAEMASRIQTTIETGQESAWLLANQKNDAFVDSIAGISELPTPILQRYLSRNIEALNAFQKRKVAGLNLSDRVFKYTNQFKREIELGLDIGIGEGRSADQIAQGLRTYLNNPELLFRRVRSKRGNLVLSKAAKDYHPGRGVYRSSYKNAMRLARTEINTAYRESDFIRYNQLDFVVGIEIRRSNNRFDCDLCGPLAGKYPKTFKFTGWHPNCRCYAVSILASREELSQLNRMLLGGTPLGGTPLGGTPLGGTPLGGTPLGGTPLQGEDTSGFRSENEVTEVSSGFTDWVEKHRQQLQRTANPPSFVADNLKAARIRGGSIQPGSGNMVPVRLESYEGQFGITVNREPFGLLNQPVPLFMPPTGIVASYSPILKSITIPIDFVIPNSQWHPESLIYHEYGHAIDFENRAGILLQNQPSVVKVMDKYRKRFGMNGNQEYIRLSRALMSNLAKATGDSRGQLSAALDTIMALNYYYGDGHDIDYYQQKGRPEAEFIAHGFVNYYLGNPIIKAYMPQLYADSLKMIQRLIKRITPTPE